MPLENKSLKFAIIIPAYNEEDFIGLCLNSLVNQSLLPSKIIVVDDGSTDNTLQVIERFRAKIPYIKVTSTGSRGKHQPGAKVILAFNKGLQQLNIDDYDVICKFDADLEFPENYIEKLNDVFLKNPKVGLCGGICTIEKNAVWMKENLTNKDHVRGALKAYRIEAFKTISGLQSQMGWDTADEFKLRFKKWKVQVILNLTVKHLKPTAIAYQDSYFKKQGQVFYALRYGYLLTLLAALKIAKQRNQLSKYKVVLSAYQKSKAQQLSYLLTESEGKFLRQYRWKQIRQKLWT